MQFNQHVIIETNKSTERIFPVVPDVEHPDFFPRMNKLVELNVKLSEIGKSDMPDALKTLARLPYMERLIAGMFQIFIMKPIECGSYDLAEDKAALTF
jgi:magnesium-protoporphyrin IX monomethyl ester (oxidative) cyclase